MKIILTYLLILSPLFGFSQLRINEVSSSNGIVLDEFGDSPDWVEIKNTGTEPVLLSEYFLSDDENDLFKWNFPNLVLNPDEFLVVFSEDETPSSVHFNFGLSSSGESLFLSRVPLGLLQSLEIPLLHADDSYGFNDLENTYSFYRETTPGSENISQDFIGYSQALEISNQSGFYEDPFTMNVTDQCPAGQVYITLDGKSPDASDTAINTLEISNTAILKAACIEPEKLPSRVLTRSFLYNQTESLPLISLSIDPDSLFDDTLGIHSLGLNADSIWPFFGANFWEKKFIKANFEFFENSELQVSQELDLSIHGGKSSRNKRQKPLRLTARKRYGNEYIDHTFFEEKPNVHRFKHILLRNSGADFLHTNFRDGYWHQLAQKENLDFDVLAFQPAVVLINGEYWGIMNIRERVSEFYIAENHDVPVDDLLMVEKELEPILGDTIHFHDFKEFVINEDLSLEENFLVVQDQLDIKSYMDYFSFEIFSGNLDWPSNNIKTWKESPTSGKWKYIMFDLDTTAEIFPFINMDADMFEHILITKIWSINAKIFANLIENAEFKRQFINRLADLTNTSLSEDNLNETLDEVAAEIELQIVPHFNKWFADLNRYDEHRNGLFPELFSVRKGFVQEHMVDHFSLENVVELNFEVYPIGAGTIDLNTISPELPFTGDYFNGNAIDLEIIPEGNNQFLKWQYSEGEIENKENPILQRNFEYSGTITAIFEDNNTNDLSILNTPLQGNLLSTVYNSNLNEEVQISVFDLTGKVVASSSELADEGKNLFRINVPELTQGAYFVSVISKDSRVTQKFVKL